LTAGVVPKGIVPLQSKTIDPAEPVTTDEKFGVRVAQLLLTTAVVAGIARKV
jgi:hypothetical protein